MLNNVRIFQTKGSSNLLLIVVVTGFAAIMVLLMGMAVFFNHINSIMYTVKVDMFLINRSAIIAFNKDSEARGVTDVNRDEYYKYFKQALQSNYGLDENMESGSRFIERIDILKYEYITEPEPTIQTQIGVKVTPIVFKEALKDIFYFKINQDVKVNKVLE